MRGMGRKGSSSSRGAHDISAPIASHHQPLSHVGCPVGGSSSSSVSIPCASRSATPDGGPTTAASGIPTPQVDNLAVSTRLGRVHIKLVNGVLHPFDVCARRITTIFKERLDENGHCWKNVSMETKEFYWNEFQQASLGRDPLPFELFKVTHTKKGTSDLVDARAEAIRFSFYKLNIVGSSYLQLEDQASQTQEGAGASLLWTRCIIYGATG
ncbi:hypothetical protein J5N97_013185 [Dioscorea zingiberensis]|uniref:Uncharacterized protein n=1 Tax=Dioscorea zingiberensis TaxID=325984 RepID=A0A9D5CQB4_9LILI|nr:hypothetical protein J5N97_013185 [Dioscorea zingiberensis]